MWIASSIAVASWGNAAQAQTLRDVLAHAYRTNPQIRIARSRLKAAEAEVAVARAAGLPTLSLASGGRWNVDQGAAIYGPADYRALDATADATVPLYTGGEVSAMIAAARARVRVARADVSAAENDVLTAVSGAFLDVLLAQAALAPLRENIDQIDAQRRGDLARLQRGEATWTDVWQGEARLADARARVSRAEARLQEARATFEAVTGVPPLALVEETLSFDIDLTAMLDRESVLNAIDTQNPELAAARAAAVAARFDLAAARARLRPRVSIVAQARWTDVLPVDRYRSGSFIDGRLGSNVSIGLALTIPIFQGGGPTARVRRARAVRAIADERVILVQRRLVAESAQQQAALRSGTASVPFAEANVTASRAALVGVVKERSIGARTSLEVLNAQTELVNGQLNLLTVRRSAQEAQLQLRRLTGRVAGPEIATPPEALAVRRGVSRRWETDLARYGIRPAGEDSARDTLRYDFAGLTPSPSPPARRLPYARLI